MKKRLLCVLIIVSIVVTVCLYTKNLKTEQEVINVAEEQTEKTKEYEEVASELTMKEEELAAALTESKEKEEEVAVQDKEILKAQAVIAYRQFMDGRRSINGVNIYELAMPTGEPDSRYPTIYAVIDVNGDGIPELNIRTAREFNVISFEDGDLRWFKYMQPGSVGNITLLKNGAYMYYSDRFSTCFYRYFELDTAGNEINEISFYWDENNGNYIPDEFDDFFFDDNACSMEEWYDKTREYLYTDENGREQIRNQVEWMTYCEADPFETNGQVLYDWISGGYQLTLYDKEHNEILSESYPESMWIDGISEDVLEIGILVNNSANYTYYFNKETAQISDTFYNAIVVGDKYIAYMEDDVSDREERILILSDIFKEGILYQEITRDFSKTAEPMSAVISIEMIDDETVRLEYYQGEDAVIECEDISIKPILTSYRIQDKHITQDIKGTQSNEELPEVYYCILNQGMAVEGEGREYSKDEIMADSEMPLIFKTILCGDFENIPWGDKVLDDEKDIYYEEYQNRETWQFLLKDLDGDDREELMIRNEEGRLMIFYEQWGDMEGTEGRFYWCTMGEGDEDSNIMQMLQDEHNEIPCSYRCDIYLKNGLLAGFSRYMRNGHTDIYCDIEKETVYGTKQYLEKCWIRKISNYEEYQSYLKYYNVVYEDDDDRSKMTHNGTYYFIDGEMVSREDVEAWLEEKVWQQMIPAEEWGIVP